MLHCKVFNCLPIDLEEEVNEFLDNIEIHILHQSQTVNVGDNIVCLTLTYFEE